MTLPINLDLEAHLEEAPEELLKETMVMCANTLHKLHGISYGQIISHMVKHMRQVEDEPSI